jgi:F0F1-type ATP synthase membrane subunit a
MGLLVITAWFTTRRLSIEPPISRWQNLLEIVVTYIREQIREITLQQPDEAGTITRTLFVGLAMIESVAIYCFVISIILIFANPFWNYMVAKSGG